MILKNIVVTNGEYTVNGETKRRYLTIGQLHEHEGRKYITLDAHVNLAGLIRKEGETRVFANFYDVERRDASAPAQSRSGVKNGGRFDENDLNDDIPF